MLIYVCYSKESFKLHYFNYLLLIGVANVELKIVIDNLFNFPPKSLFSLAYEYIIFTESSALLFIYIINTATIIVNTVLRVVRKLCLQSLYSICQKGKCFHLCETEMVLVKRRRTDSTVKVLDVISIFIFNGSSHLFPCGCQSTSMQILYSL